MKSTYSPQRLNLNSIFRAFFIGAIFIAGSGCGLFGACETEDKARGYSVGEEGRLRFYFQHFTRGTIATSEGVWLDEEDDGNNHGDAGIGRGARRVITVRDVDDPARVLPELHFESGDPEIFEVEASGCTPDENCPSSTCPIDHERFECDAPDVYRVRLGLFSEGIGRLIVRDAEGDVYDAVDVRIYLRSDEDD